MGTAVFTLEAVVVVLSFLAGLGASVGPAFARIALAFLALVIIPGHSLSVLLFRSSASILETACGAFSMGLVFVSAVVCAGFMPGVSYGAISAAAAAAALVLAFLARRAGRRRGGGGDRSPRAAGST